LTFRDGTLLPANGQATGIPLRADEVIEQARRVAYWHLADIAKLAADVRFRPVGDIG
jgi:hypothetical protein